MHCTRMNKSMEAEIVLLLFVAFLTVITCAEQQANVVIPDLYTSCPTGGQQCQTLEFYIENAQNYFISNTVMVFLPGTYQVLRNGLIKISHVENFALVGSANFNSTKIPAPSTTIYCSGTAAFVFHNVSNLHLANITFSNCGAETAALSSPAYATLYLEEVVNLQMEKVVVQKSRGHGIWGYNILGNVSIHNSVLKHNGANEGSNMRLDYRLNSACDNLISLTLELNIHSSKVLFGRSQNDGAGLNLNFHGSCYQAIVKISDMLFNGNKALSTGSGGNMRIVIGTDAAVDIKICVHNSSFLNGEASNGGGMAFIIESPDKILSHDEFCSALSSKIYWLALNSTFLSNHARKEGGGIFMASLEHHPCREVKAYFSDITLDRNTAEDLGGGLRVANISITIDGGYVTNGSAAYGGGIYASYINPFNITSNSNDFQQFNVTGMQLHENTALHDEGGNMCIEIEISDNSGDIQIYIDNSTFQTGMAGYGGGMALVVISSNWSDQLLCPVVNKVNLLLLNCSFRSNHAMQNGGGLYLYFSHRNTCYEVRASITNVTVGRNTAGEVGGGFFVADFSSPQAKVSIVVHGGSVTGGAAGWGGGITYYSGSHISESSSSMQSSAPHQFNITGVLLHNNRAFSGSGGNMYILAKDNNHPSDVQIFIHNSTYYHGKATFSGGGMGIAVAGDSIGSESCSMRTISLHIGNSYFLANTALIGGGALLMQFGQTCYHVKALVGNTTFKDNIAFDSGGGIWLQDYNNHSSAVTMHHCSISGGKASSGGGVAFYFSTTNQASFWTISNSTISNNSATVNGGGLLVVLASLDKSSRYSRACYLTGNVTLHLLDTVIANNMVVTSGENGSGGGLFVQLSHDTKSCIFARIWIAGCTFSSNNVSGLGHGGNIAMLDYINAVASTISMQNTIVRNGKAYNGGGMYYISRQLPLQCNCTSGIKSQQVVYVSRTQFIGNIALGAGADVMFTMDTQDADKETLSQISTKEIQLESNTFVGSSCFNQLFGACPTIRVEDTSKWYPEQGCIYKFIFQNSTITYVSGPVFLLLICKAMFSDVQFTGIGFSALAAVSSNIVFKGNNLFVGNYGYNGGALSLLGDNRILLEPNTSITFRDNFALHAGGAIFVNDFRSHFSSSTPCLFQPYMPSHDFIYGNPNISIYMDDNRAQFAGTALYGGYVDQCITYQKYHDLNISLSITPSQLFDSIFHFLSPNNSDYSVIASDPTGVCMCEDDKPHCEVRVLDRSAFPGALLVIPAIAVGQRNGTVKDGVVFAVQETESPFTSTQGSVCTDKTLSSGTLCQNVYFRLHSPDGTTHVYLTPGNEEGGGNVLDYYLQVRIDVLPCPLGFQLQQNFNLQEQYACGCDVILQRYGINCSIDDQTIQRPQESWIGMNCTNFTQSCGVIVHAHCPFHYCRKEILDLHLNNSDAQCNFNHSGILCGGCRPGYSLVLGSSRCLQCSNMFLLLFLVFLLAGLTLVLLLMLCNMTVSDGTVNGLIFYANIVGINSAIFFPAGQGNRFVSFLNVFIAWFNLDLGIETCLYDGMSMYQNTWFQFAFPLYIWTIVLFLVTSTHYFVFAAKVLVRRNAVKVLATLFLLSFTKLLQTIIISFSFITLEYPDGKNKALWLYDSNLEFLTGKHIPLFIAALLVFVFLMLPYTVLLTFGQCIQRKSSHPLLSWYTRLRLQPLLDAYAGPYKDRYRFWSGLLVTVRIMISFVFAMNALGNPNINLVAITTASVLLAVCTIGLSFYKRWSITMLETLSHINLCFLSVATLFVRSSGGSQVVVTSTFVGLCFCLFSAIASYHTLQELSKTKLGLRVKTSCTQILLTLPCLRRQTGAEEDLPQQNEVEGQTLPRRAPVQHWEIALENPVGGEATLMPVLPSGTYPQSTKGHSSQTNRSSAHAEQFSEEAYWHQSQPCHNPSESLSPNPVNQVDTDERLQSHLVPDIDSAHQHYSNTSEIGINSSSTLYKACSSSFITSTSNDNPEHETYVELETVRQNNSVNTFTDFAEVPSNSEYRDQTLPVNSCSHSQFETENKNPVEVIHHDEDSNSDTSADEYQSLLHN